MGGARGSASGLRQGSALHPRRVFDPLDTLFAIELSAFSCYARVFMQGFRACGRDQRALRSPSGLLRIPI